MATGGWTSGTSYNANQLKEEGEGHYQGGCHPGNSFQSMGWHESKDYNFYHRGGGRREEVRRSWGRGRGNRGRGGDRRPNGFGPNVSRFDDEINIGPSLDMTPVADVANKNVYWDWCEKNKGSAKSEPLKFEEPKTDFHLQVAQEMRELREERKLLTDRWGRPISDCRSNHSYNEMCQFCDGDRGKWASKNPRPDKAFKRYQESILASFPNQEFEAVAGSARSPRYYANPSKLAPIEDPVFADDDYGPEEENEVGIFLE